MNSCSAQMKFRVSASNQAMAGSKVFALLIEVMRRSQQPGLPKLPALWTRPFIPYKDWQITGYYINRQAVIYPLPAEQAGEFVYEIEYDAQFSTISPGWSSLEEAHAAIAQVFDIVTAPDVQLISVEESVIHWGA